MRYSFHLNKFDNLTFHSHGGVISCKFNYAPILDNEIPSAAKMMKQRNLSNDKLRTQEAQVIRSIFPARFRQFREMIERCVIPLHGVEKFSENCYGSLENVEIVCRSKNQWQIFFAEELLFRVLLLDCGCVAMLHVHRVLS